MTTTKIDTENVGKRLDHFLSEVYPDKSRSYLQKLIKNGDILVNDSIVKTGYILLKDDVISEKEVIIETLDLKPVDMALDIVYEDEYLLVINKAKGLVVHPASTYKEPTLVHGLLHQIDDLSSINGVIRPGIIHRIDKDTSGLLLVAKNDAVHKALSEDLKRHDVKRKYLALVYGIVENKKGIIDAPIGRDTKNRLKFSVHKDGKHAVTHFNLREQFKNFALVECELETGRTHQIRVHMAYIGHPIVGDPMYGPKKIIGKQGQFLHAYELSFLHPIKNEQMTFTCDLPKYFKDYLADLS